jgi:hypothetical protein
VRVEFVVMDGDEGKALRQHQAAVMRRVLKWLHDHPPGEPSEDATTE